jgi:mannose-6-phosphate isomerase
MDRLRGRVRGYAWGSRSVLASLLGRPVPSPGPEAELWFGAHASDPSTVETKAGLVSLPELIAKDPDRALGPAVLARFGPRLPYLLKVLAAEAPLSLQAHPDAAQARAGYAAGNPSYVDPYHKPELLVAVSEFVALCGFRAPEVSARALHALGVPALEPVVAGLAGPGPVEERLRAAVTALLTWPVAGRAELVSAVAAAGPGEVPELATRYPDDLGVVVSLLLNRVVLAPGEAIWMPAGNLHSYLRGTGVEVMVASDNVLRGGFTPKRVDVNELLRVLRFEVLAEPVRRPVPVGPGADPPVGPGVETWPVPVPDFALHRVTVRGDRREVPAAGPRIALCLSGEVGVDDGAGAVTLVAGEAAFATAGSSRLAIAGHGEVFVAAPGDGGPGGDR